MTTTIGYIVYGINLKNAPFRKDVSLLEEYSLANVEYSGKGKSPIYIGLSEDSIAEATDVSEEEMSDLFTKAVSSEARKELQEQLDAILNCEEPKLSDEFKEWIKNQKPQAFITWATD